MKTAPLVIPLPDYERIFRVIHAVMTTAGANVPKSCIFFSIAGSYFLNKVYKIQAQVVGGAALYCLDESTQFVSVIGGMRDDRPYSDKDTFHCWVQTKTHAIDFTAPIFREQLAAAGYPGAAKIPRWMFQRPLAEMQEKEPLRANGDFDLWPNAELTEHVVNKFFKTHMGPDLLNVCESWFRKPPKKMAETLGLADSQGPTKLLRLSPLRIDGAWGR
jgi:hypothetical protein